MRKEILALSTSALVLLAMHTGIAQHSHQQHQTAQQQEQANTQKYTCIMHPEVITDQPGNCPKCGMQLVPLAEEKRSTPMNREQALNAPHSMSNAESSRLGVGQPAREDFRSWAWDVSDVRRILLTASGGPFRETPRNDFDAITVEQALKHPTWNMGPKITIDSATTFNKRLQIIDTHRL